jgi:CRP-like cAMP-binding protein
MAAVNVLDEDPGLGESLTPEALERARSQAEAPLLTLPSGRWNYVGDAATMRGHLGLLVLDGLLARHVLIGSLGSTEFLGSGDLLRPWSADSGTLAQAAIHWEVLAETRLAVLDHDFAMHMRPWPEIAAALLDRADQRARSLAFQLALRQAVRVEDRVLVALRHLADRWGRVGPQGTTLALPRTSGAVLARIVGARRQSVSAALTSLRRQELIDRRRDGTWVLREYPKVDALTPGRRASDVAAGDLLSAAS